MKRFLLFIIACLLIAPASFSGGRNAKNKPADAAGAATAAAVADDREIHWMNIDEVQVAMKKEPRKVWVDVYTGWCGWCKKMDQTTFSNPNVIKYMNTHFYAVKLDAEQTTDIRFLGKMFPAAHGDHATHPFATELLHGQMSYPTTVVMEESFQSPQPIPGYQDVKTVEMVMKYFGEGVYKTTPWAEYQAAFKQTWM